LACLDVSAEAKMQIKTLTLTLQARKNIDRMLEELLR
jgi:hypothetical protein